MASEDDIQSGSSDEELEMTAADVLRKLEEVCYLKNSHTLTVTHSIINNTTL